MKSTKEFFLLTQIKLEIKGVNFHDTLEGIPKIRGILRRIEAGADLKIETGICDQLRLVDPDMRLVKKDL